MGKLLRLSMPFDIEKESAIFEGLSGVSKEDQVFESVSDFGVREDQIFESLSEPLVAPTTELPLPEPTKVAPDFHNIAKDFYGQAYGYDIDNPPPYTGQLDAIVNTMARAKGLVQNPYDAVKGVAEFVSAMPGFVTGLATASGAIVERMAASNDWTINDLYNSASEEMSRVMEVSEEQIVSRVSKGLEIPRQAGYDLAGKLFDKEIKKETGDPGLVGELIMAPYLITSTPLHILAEKFEDENVKGLIHFTADAAGFAVLGGLHRRIGLRQMEEAKPIVEKATKIEEAQQMVEGIPNETIQRAQQRVIDVEKQQLELEAKIVRDKIEAEIAGKAELAAKGRRVEEIKEFEEAYEAYEPEVPLKIEPSVEAEVGDIIEVGENKVKYDGTYDFPDGSKKYGLTIQDGPAKGGSIIADSLKPEDVAKSVDAANERFAKAVPIKEVDMQTGTKEPVRLSTEQSPFRQDKEITDTKAKLYEENAELVASDMETYVGKLINDVNRWLDGNDSINKTEVSNKLSLAAARGEFSPEFKKSVSEAASWARKADRKIIERTGVKLSSGIDPTDVSKVVQLITQPMREFQRDLGKELKGRALETMLKIDSYKDWEFSKGDRIRSNTSDKVYEVTGKGWDKRKDVPLYTYKSATESGTFYAEKAHEGFTKLTGPIGVKLYSGIPLEKAAKEIVKLYDRARAAGKHARGVKSFKPVAAAKMLREEFNRAFVDRSGNIRGELLKVLGEEGYKVAQKMYLSKGASSVSAHMMEQMRKEVYRGLTRHEKEILDEVIFHTRMLDLAKYKTEKDFKYFKEHPPSESAAFLTLFETKEKLTPEQVAKIDQATKSYFEWMKLPLNDMFEAGLITEVEHAALSAHNYRKLELVDVFDKRSVQKVGAKKRTVYDSGVEALQRGRDTDIFERSSEVMALEVFNRAYGRILNNEANKALLETARENPDNPFVRVKDKPSDHIPSGWNRIFTYEEGVRKPIYLSPEMSKEWITNAPELSYKMSQMLRYSTGSPVIRFFATGINWGFALANLPRDVMHTWFTARVFKDGKWESVYSPQAPLFGLQIGSDLSTVFLDAATKGKRYEQYIKEGGGMEFLVHQGRLFQRGRHVNRPLDDFFNFMGYFGETSEIMTRLAIRERVIKKKAREQGLTVEQARKNKDITREATFAARDYMDFGQGGGIAKALDNAFPYLNAGIQGTRGMFRAFKPGSGTALQSTWKLTQFAGVVSGIYIASHKMAPETMKELEGNIDMQNNLVIPLGDQFSFVDERGQTRYPYVKIPLDPGQKFFKTFFEASTDKWLGNEIDINRVVDSLKEQSPVGVTELPPTISGTLGYVTNKDFWLNEDIWKKTEPFKFPGSKEEFIPGRTPQALVDVGQATGLSPERMNYAISELVTNGTVWSYLLGQGYNELFGDLPKDMKEKHLAMVLAKTPIIKRFFGVTNPYSKHAAKIDEAEERDVLQRWIQNRELDRLAEGYLHEGSIERKEVFEYIRSVKDKKVYDRLIDRFKFQETIKALPDRSFWLRIKGLSPEARAELYVDRLESSSPEEKEQLNKELSIIIKAGGIVSKSFRAEVAKIRGREE